MFTRTSKLGEMEIHGRVFGNIEAKRRIEIYPTGRVRGDIQSPTLIINSGGMFDGRSRMADPAKSDEGMLKNSTSK